MRLFGMFLMLMLIFTVVGWVIGTVFFNDWLIGAVIFLSLIIAVNLISYLYSDKIVLWSYHAKIVTENEAPRLHKIVRYVSQLNGLPMPRIAIVQSKTPNAFATGRNPNKAVVAATVGILETLTDNELTGVIAHEMAHVKDRDILVMTVAATVAGAIAFFARIFVWNMFLGGGRRREGNADILIAILVAITAPIAALAVRLAISRSREYKADFEGAKTIGKPNHLADALEKLEAANLRRPITQGNPASSSLFIVNPFRGSGFFTMFSTHPPIEKRVKRLRDMAKGKIQMY